MQNKVFIGDRNVGKTTWLFDYVRKYAEDSSKKIVILDSATEHIDKSLLHKVKSTFPNTSIIYPNDRSWLISSEITLMEYYEKCKNSSITNAIAHSTSQINCIDLSFYLERGHEFASAGNLELAQKYRCIYNNLSQQVALCCMILVNEGIIDKMVVVTDEIEFPRHGLDLSKYQNKNILFVSAVHPENSFGKFYKSFKNIEIYRRDNCDKGF